MHVLYIQRPLKCNVQTIRLLQGQGKANYRPLAIGVSLSGHVFLSAMLVYMRISMSNRNRPFLPGYLSSLENSDAKKRYSDKLAIIGLDPYETARNEWLDDVDMWPSVTCIHIAMFLLVTPSPYTGEDLMNYKSLECYRNFLAGWVREILVKAPNDDHRVAIAKVTPHCASNKRYCHYVGKPFAEIE